MAIIRDNNSAHSLFGGAGDDVIFGNGGDDTIDGGDGNDRIIGGSGTDVVRGGAGDDTFVFFNQSAVSFGEVIGGGTGFDTLLLSSAESTGPLDFYFEELSLWSIERLQLSSGWNDITATFQLDAVHPLHFSAGFEIMGGAGTDTLNFYVNGGAKLDLREAKFTNWRSDDAINIYVQGWEATVSGTDQADEIWVEYGVFGELNGNGGDDVIHCSMLARTAIDGGAGRDCIAISDIGDFLQSRLTSIEEIRFENATQTSWPNILASFNSKAFDAGSGNSSLHFVDASDTHPCRVQVVMLESEGDTHVSAARFTFENWDAANEVLIVGNSTDNTIVGSLVNDQIFGGGGNDVLTGGSGNDTIDGSDGNDWIYGGTGKDSVLGGAGDDIIVFRSELDADALETIDGGAGFDTLRLSSYGSAPGSGIHINFEFAFLSSIERLQFASWWNDITVSFQIDPDVPTQFSSNLEFAGGAGRDTVDFFLHDGASLDLQGATFTNWQSNDAVSIHVWGSKCAVNGTSQSDEIWLWGAVDSLIKGNGGDDLFHCSPWAFFTSIDGGAGRDCIAIDDYGIFNGTRLTSIEEIRFETPTHTQSVTAQFGSWEFDNSWANPSLHFVDASDTGACQVLVTLGDDTHFSAARFTFENWDAANEVHIIGNSKDSTIVGSAVDDEIFAYWGSDVLTGGGGNDTFTYRTVADSEAGSGFRDRILDFSSGDKIDLSVLDASAALAGDQAFVIDTDGVLAEGEIQFTGNFNTVIRINLDADPEADMEIVLRGVTPGSLSGSDFIL